MSNRTKLPVSGKNHPHRVSELIPRKMLDVYQGRIETHRKLLGAIRHILPPELAEHCMDCVANGRTLILYAKSGVWTSQLRFYLPRIIAELAEAGHTRFQLGKVRTLRLAAGDPKPTHRPPKPNIPNPEMIATLEATARAADDEIGHALLRLCHTLRQTPR